MKEIVCQAKQGQKNAEKLNRAPKRSILGPQNLGLGGGLGTQDPSWIRFWNGYSWFLILVH